MCSRRLREPQLGEAVAYVIWLGLLKMYKEEKNNEEH